MTANGMFVLMGSGETTPTMVTIHQKVFAATAERRDADVVAGALLDTPYGFQENAEEISDKARHYFSHHVGRDVARIDARVLDGAPAIEREGVLDQIRRLDWLFTGPGSPTYAQRQWSSGPYADAFAGVVSRGGTLIMASAAAVSAGQRTIPVYEVYKAGIGAHWAPGLDLTRRLLGWSCIVIPHFDNAEGGSHDTRFCYMGERRLTQMEAELDDGTWILGVDEHTAAILDLEAGTMTVQGRGGVHLRRDSQPVASFASGEVVTLDDVEATALGRATSGAPSPASDATGGAAREASGTDGAEPGGAGQDDAGDASASLGEQTSALAVAFDTALADGDARAATAAALQLEQLIRDWSSDSLTGGDMDDAVAALRAMITRLGGLAGDGLHDHTELVRPLIESMLHVREDARKRKAFEVADHIRDHMDADGIQVRDTREGTEWDWDEPSLSS